MVAIILTMEKKTGIYHRFQRHLQEILYFEPGEKRKIITPKPVTLNGYSISVSWPKKDEKIHNPDDRNGLLHKPCQ